MIPSQKFENMCKMRRYGKHPKSASKVPHLRHLRHLHYKCLKMRHSFQPMRMLEFCHVTCIVQSQRQNEYYYMYVGKLVYNFSLAYLGMFWNVLECSGISQKPLENFIFLLYFVYFCYIFVKFYNILLYSLLYLFKLMQDLWCNGCHVGL